MVIACTGQLLTQSPHPTHFALMMTDFMVDCPVEIREKNKISAKPPINIVFFTI
jgi:hypothetical protein